MGEHMEFAWSDRFLLGFSPLDDTHREFVALAGDLLAVDDGALPAALDAFIAHAQSHFSEEEAWMRGSAFPATDCHVEEHEKVFDSAHQVRDKLLGGNTAIARAFARALIDWFPAHADYMDAALAQWMVRRQQGGVPVVLRRNIIKPVGA